MARLYPIVSPGDILARPAAALEIIALADRFLQLRGGTEDEILEAARLLLETARANRRELIINNSPEIAKKLGLGVHLGQDDMPVSDARTMLGPDVSIGISTHNERDLDRIDDADYVSVGPIFPTNTKRDAAPVVGIEFIRRARQILDERGMSQIPIVAIGGITPQRASECIAAGATHLAVIGALRNPMSGELRDDLSDVAREFQF